MLTARRTGRRLEWSPARSASNAARHGVSFEEAQGLFEDPEHIEVVLPYPGAPRLAVVGRIRDEHWTAMAVCRPGSARIISARRSHPSEERAYDESL